MPARLSTSVDDDPSGEPSLTQPSSSEPSRRGPSRGSATTSSREAASAGADGRPQHRWPDRLLVGAGLVVAMFPSLLAAARACHDGWRPVLDDARIAAEATSFAHGHPALLGAPSTSLENLTGIRPVNHLGPAESYLLGLGQLVAPSNRTLLAVAVLIAVAAAAVLVVAASRLGGAWAGLGAGAVTGVVAAHLGTPVLADIWNPYLPILPLAAALLALSAAAFACWRPGLPLAVLFATLSAQSHLTHGPLLLAASAPIALMWRWARRERKQNGDVAQPRLAIPLVVTALIFVVLWAPPAVSEFTAGHSNMGNLWRAITADTGQRAFGVGYALQVFARVVARPVPFGPPVTSGSVWVVPRQVSFGLVFRLLASVAPLVILLVDGWRRRDRTAMAVTASALAADVMAVGLLSASTFTSGAALYQTRWLWALSILHWGGVVIVGARAGGDRRRGRPPVDPRSAPRPELGPRSLAARLAEARQTLGRDLPPAVSWIARVAVLLLAGVAITSSIAAPTTARTIIPDWRIRMHTVADLQRGVAATRGDAPHLIVRLAPGVAPASSATIDLIGNLIASGEPVLVDSPSSRSRRYFGPSYVAERGDQGVHLVVTDRLAEPVMTKAGYAKVSEVPPLSREERRSLRRIEADLRHRYDRGDFRLGGLAGLSLDKGRQASGELFDENQVEALAFAGDLDGKPPPVDLMRKFSELRRRARPESAFIVWRAPH